MARPDIVKVLTPVQKADGHPVFTHSLTNYCILWYNGDVHRLVVLRFRLDGGANMKRLETGQGLVEYALILVLVAIVVIAVLLLLGPAIGDVFSTIINSI
jgi:pilus assembly protein Flp/PilA